METRLSGCHWKSTQRSDRVFFATLLLLHYISPPAELRSTKDGQAHSAPRAHLKETVWAVWSLSHMWHYKLPVFAVGESKNSVSIENWRADFSCADGGCIWGASFKAEGRLMIWPLPSPPGEGGEGQPPPAAGSATLYCCREKTAVALHRPIRA